MGCEPRWAEGVTPTAAPTCDEPGSALLLFDYHCYHRGRANHSPAPRPVAYTAFALRCGVTDAHNFPSTPSLLVGGGAGHG